MTKRGAPSHVRKPVFYHPAAENPLVSIINKVPDPGSVSPNFKYSLTTVVFIVTVSMLCGADDWEDMSTLAEQLSDWIANYVDLQNGVPSSHTLERLISLIEPTALETMLREITSLFCDSEGSDVIAIDGKSLRGSRTRNNKAIHLLHAYSCRNRVCIGQVKVDDKSNEITAICGLMDQLFLKGNIVTVDALNTQRAVAAKAVEKEAKYILPVKQNQAGLLESIQALFFDAERSRFAGIDADEYESLEKSRGRIEERYCKVIDASDIPETLQWAGLNTAIRMTRRRTDSEGKTSEEIIYYISNLELEAEKIARAIRDHWGIENGLHYALDMVLDEDGEGYSHRNGATNLSVIRKIVLAALEKTPTDKKRSKKTKRLLALIDPKFRAKALKFLF